MLKGIVVLCAISIRQSGYSRLWELLLIAFGLHSEYALWCFATLTNCSGASLAGVLEQPWSCHGVRAVMEFRREAAGKPIAGWAWPA